MKSHHMTWPELRGKPPGPRGKPSDFSIDLSRLADPVGTVCFRHLFPSTLATQEEKIRRMQRLYLPTPSPPEMTQEIVGVFSCQLWHPQKVWRVGNKRSCDLHWAHMYCIEIVYVCYCLYIYIYYIYIIICVFEHINTWRQSPWKCWIQTLHPGSFSTYPRSDPNPQSGNFAIFSLTKWAQQNSYFSTWRIIPFSKWLVTPIYYPFRPFLEGEQPQLGDLRSPWLIYHLLSGMILQVGAHVTPLMSGVDFFFTPGFPHFFLGRLQGLPVCSRF